MPILIVSDLPQAPAAEAPQPVELSVYPERIVLSSMRDRQGMVVQARFADGSTRDVSAVAVAKITGPEVARLKGTVLEPLADGQAELQYGIRRTSGDVPVDVSGLNRATTAISK